MFLNPMRQFKHAKYLAWIAILSATSVFAQTANFGKISLAPGFDPGTAIATGSTGGYFSLPSLANRDRHNNFCLGYSGNQTPDHILTLERDFPKLRLQVDSRGTPTTLVVRGPSGTVRCGNTSLEDTDWKAGNYSVWVGAKNEGVQSDYTLSVRE
ncbi:hypothetical protein [Aerosakkonema funiforme]|uniref:hypothetical protein n=1 Tax=Aerosakkonema funiforme TaxID=1246630 RepID=UPI0035BB5060